MKKILSILLIAFISGSVIAQAPDTLFTLTYGGTGTDIANAIIETYDKEYLVVGQTSSNDGDVYKNNGGFDYWILKLDVNLDTIWTKVYGGSEDDIAQSVVQTQDSGFIVVGTSESNDGDVFGNHGNRDIWALKLDDEGDTLWTKSFGGSNYESGNSIQKSTDTGFIIAGSTSSTDGDVGENKGGSDYWVINIDSLGNIIWEQTYGGSSSEYTKSIIPTPDSGQIMIGSTSSWDGDVSNYSGIGIDPWVVKADSVGEIEWNSCYGNIEIPDLPGAPDYGMEIIQYDDTSYVFCGWGDYIGENDGNNRLCISAINENGSIIWEYSRDIGTGLTYPISILKSDFDASLIGVAKYSLFKISRYGEFMWLKYFWGPTTRYFTDIIELDDYKQIISGTKDNDLWLLKINDDAYVTTTDTIQVNHESDSIKVSVVSNDEWEVNTNANWLYIIPNNGVGNDTITLIYDSNQTEYNRDAMVKLNGIYADTSYLHFFQTNSYFIPNWVGNPYQSMSLLVKTANLSGFDLDSTHEIGVFDFDILGNKICVGIGRLDGPISPDNPILIKAATDDPTTEAIDGFKPGNTLYFHIWDSINQVEYQNVAVQYNELFDSTFTSLGTALVELSGYVHYQPIWFGSGYQKMTIDIESASINGYSLGYGDVVGLFDINGSDTICVGEGLVKESVSPTTPITILASEDDPSTPETDGFTPGNNLIVRVWDTSGMKEYVNLNISFDNTYDTVYTSSGNAKLSLTASGYFQPAWSGSPYETMVIDIVEANILGNSLQINDEIGLFDITGQDTICIGAGIVDDNFINGDTLKILASMDNPATTGIDGFIPGKPILFQIWDSTAKVNYLNINARFITGFDDVYTASGRAVAEITAYGHFKPLYVGELFQPMNIEVTAALINGNKMQAGDEIGIFDLNDTGQPICVGAGILPDSLYNSNTLTVWAATNDTATTLKDGFTDGNDISFRLWDTLKMSEYDFITSVFDTLLDTVFTANGHAKVALTGYSHFQPVWNGNPYTPMAVIVNGAMLDGTDLVPGDEIGIFDTISDGSEICVGTGLVTQTITPSDILTIVVSADDPTSPDQDGFISGREIRFKVWKDSEQQEHEDIVATFNPALNELFTAWGTALVELNAVDYITQTIDFIGGWNIESFAVTPDSLDMVYIHQDLIDSNYLIKVIDESGGFMQYIPGFGWINTIDTLKSTEGYYIKVTTNTALKISGNKIITPFTIPLISGWNMHSYPLLEPQDAIDAYQELIDNGELIKVIDEAGGFIQEIPGFGWINTIYNLETGKGYYIKVNTNTSLTLDYPIAKSSYIKQAVLVANHFKKAYINNPYSPMNILVSEINIDGLTVQEGDEIAVYDGDLCVGTGVISANEYGYTVSISTSKDDPTTEAIDGFTEGNEITFKFYSTGTLISEKVASTTIYGSSYFESLGTYVCKLKGSVLDTENTGIAQFSFKIIPNPVESFANLKVLAYEEGDLQIEIFDISGQPLKKKTNHIAHAGQHFINLNTNIFQSGLYMIRLTFNSNGQSQTSYGKFIKQ